ncbi:hypothetical protein EF910_33530 [Streptomyces sp. WAC07149]|uniref:hypothetical protein n=1 Tax=Streptomyces sp. WAC07149 TaxID=2487425 RepID=UPI000F7AE24C|nr:hypothetical protein [Streptomyces sp. WAC07149]RSS99932.1 hypothetical protein EF910_33530 [Streptomyces sp. WAC07149]
MAHLNLARAVSGAALALAIALTAAPAAQAAPSAPLPAPGTRAAGPLSLDNLLSLRFLTPTVQDAKRQVSGLLTGLSPAPTSSTALGGLLK